MPGGTPKCSGCGHEFPIQSRSLDQKESGMTEITGNRGREYKTTLDPITFYAKKVAMGREKGYRSGWAKHQYFLVFGKWPEFHPDDIDIRQFELERRSA